MKLIRLDKLLCDAGLGTRSEVKQLLKRHNITVNGIKIIKPDTKVDTESDEVAVDGKVICHEEFEYYLLNKPAGIISAAEDKKEKTVVDLIKERKRRDLFPVGRLDRDTEGLLLITNDGHLANRLLKPGKHVDKTYFAYVRGPVNEDTKKAFLLGVDIHDETLTKPADLLILKEDESPCFKDALNYIKNSDKIDDSIFDEKLTGTYLTIREGRFHQVKRMFEAVGCEVIYLKRISMGLLKLPEDLSIGSYRKLTKEELDILQSEN